jgi:hypothetical protein
MINITVAFLSCGSCHFDHPNDYTRRFSHLSTQITQGDGPFVQACTKGPSPCVRVRKKLE